MIKNWKELDEKAFETFLNHAEQLFEQSELIDDDIGDDIDDIYDEDVLDNNIDSIHF